MEKARQSHALLWLRIGLTCCRVVAGHTPRAGFMVHDGYICNECDCRMLVGRTVWYCHGYCDICEVDICSSCMGYGENPFGHAARARALPVKSALQPIAPTVLLMWVAQLPRPPPPPRGSPGTHREFPGWGRPEPGEFPRVGIKFKYVMHKFDM